MSYEQYIPGRRFFAGGAVFLLLFLSLAAAVIPVRADDSGKEYPEYMHLPAVREDAASPTGQSTVWSCVYFGRYPLAEVADSAWDAVDEYALREGDLIRNDDLYEKLAAAYWHDDMTELDGVSYLRVGADSVSGSDEVREQHYRWDPARRWHYFQIAPIRWRVLDIQEGKALLLADRMPDCVPFHAADEDVAWPESTVRSWLNGYDASANLQGTDFTGAGFLDRAFTPEERDAIIPVHCVNLPNQTYGTSGGADTEDRLFILSNAEVFEGEDAARYGFSPGRDYDDPAKRFTSTLYAKCRGAWWSPVEAYAGNSFWFMRTSGYTPGSVTYVCDFGYIYSKGMLVTCSDAGVLPAMWIDLDKAELADAGEVSSNDILRKAESNGAVQLKKEIGDPVKVKDEAAPEGSYTVWDTVSFGKYPQTEILPEKSEEGGLSDADAVIDPALYQALEETADTGDVETVLQGVRYKRMDGRWFRWDPVIWRVLEVSDGTALLMADRCLDSVPYHAEYRDVFWENSDLRKWLNGTGQAEDSLYGSSFMEMAFTEEEQQAIVISDVSNECNYYFGTACGSGTHDKVFLLSEEEVFSSGKAEAYGFQPSDAVGDPGRRLAPTAYAAARGAWQSGEEETAGIGFWILRTNGYTRDNVVYVGEKGYLYNRGISVTCPDAGIVPAIRIRVE